MPLADALHRAPSGVQGIDCSITRQIRAGDEQAFARFYEAWFQPTLTLARAISRRDEAFALDVVQDVMMNVARKMPALDSDDALRGWMTKAVMNAVTDRCRSEQRRSRREQAVADASDDSPSEPWSELAEQERLQWLAVSMAELSIAEQALLQARYGEATTVAATATRLGITSDAAHGKLRRALDKLRQKAAEWWNA